VISHLAAAAAALALGAPAATPGVTATTITIGGTVPLNGPAAAYASVGRGAEAYFRYVNSRGGVFGRRIAYKYLDDEFEVAKTIQLTRQLVEQEQVLAIFNSVGTEHALAIRPYLNERKVPHLFIGIRAPPVPVVDGLSAELCRRRDDLRAPHRGTPAEGAHRRPVRELRFR
jgi:ABC-type branched-subunit amino acid transport system substrate-binding protein